MRIRCRAVPRRNAPDSVWKKLNSTATKTCINHIAATPSRPNVGRPGAVRRRLPEHVQLRLDMMRGRRIDLNLTRSRAVKFKVRGKDKDHDDDDDDVPEGRRRGSRVLVGERGRVSAWSDSDDEVYTLFIVVSTTTVVVLDGRFWTIYYFRCRSRGP